MIPALLVDQAAALAERDRRDKRIAAVQARAVKARFTFHITVELERPAFLIARWGWCRAFADLAGVEAFLDQHGVAP